MSKITNYGLLTRSGTKFFIAVLYPYGNTNNSGCQRLKLVNIVIYSITEFKTSLNRLVYLTWHKTCLISLTPYPTRAVLLQQNRAMQRVFAYAQSLFECYLHLLLFTIIPCYSRIVSYNCVHYAMRKSRCECETINY